MKLISNLKSQASNVRGFTLLELIIVFTVIGVLSTVGLASFSTYSKTQVLEQAHNSFVNALNQAKSRAFSQVKPVAQCDSAKTLNGYSVVIVTTSSPWHSYTLNIVCSGVSTVLSTITLPKGINFNKNTDIPPTQVTSVYFSVLTNSVTGAGNVVLYSTDLSKSITVTVTSTGIIQ